MKKILFSILLLSSLSSPSFAMDNYGIYQVLDRSIVRINIWKDFDTDDAWTVSGGSGVVINEIDGAYFILTNAHVILESFCFEIDQIEEDCENRTYDEDIVIAIDAPDTEFEYPVSYDDIMYWIGWDFAVIKVDMNNYIIEDQYHEFNPIKIGGDWYPLMDVYGAGFPSILGNYDKNYAEIIFCSGVVNTMFMDEDSLYQLGNYSIAHSCTLAGGMSGGPLVDEEGLLLGINGLTGLSELYSDDKGNLVEVDIAAARFNYAMDIWELYRLEILSLDDEAGHFNPDSIFYNYLPILSYDYHSEFFDGYINLYPEHKDRIRLLFN